MSTLGSFDFGLETFSSANDSQTIKTTKQRGPLTNLENIDKAKYYTV